MPVVLAKKGHTSRSIRIRDGLGFASPMRELDHEGVFFEKLSKSSYTNSSEIDVITDEEAIRTAKTKHAALVVEDKKVKAASLKKQAEDAADKARVAQEAAQKAIDEAKGAMAAADELARVFAEESKASKSKNAK